MIRTQISLTEQQADRLRRLAAERRTSIAALIRDAVERVLEGEDATRRRERFMTGAGAVGSGRPGSDAATEHDAELDATYAARETP